MAFTYTYDKAAAPEVFRLRRMIRDVNLDVTGLVDRRAETVFFCDEELLDFLSDTAGDYYLAAANALYALLADKKAMMTAMKLGTYGENYQVGITALAEKYQSMSDEHQPQMEVLEVCTGQDSLDEYADRGVDYHSEVD